MNTAARDATVQTFRTRRDGQRIELKIHAPKAGVSWRINSYDGEGTRELQASTFPGGRFFEIDLAETFFPKDRTKRVVRKEARIELNRETAEQLRDMLNAMLEAPAGVTLTKAGA